jgi:hypothetical protein
VNPRYPARVLVLWALASLLVVAGAGLFGYGKLGGISPSEARPYRWDGQDPLVISHHASVTESSWCQVLPADGDARTFETRNSRGGTVHLQVEPAWFGEVAEVTCQRARLLFGPFARYVDQWFTGLLLALVVVAVSGPVLTRYRRRHPEAPGPGPDVRGRAAR